MKNAQNNMLLAIGASAVIAGGLGFYGGMTYEKGQTSDTVAMPGQGMMQNGGTRGGQNVGQGMVQDDTDTNRPGFVGGMTPISGEITQIDDQTLTIKNDDGSTVLVVYSDSTKISESAEVSLSDLQLGDSATVMGIESTEGTVSANSIVVGDNGPMMGR